MSLLILFPILLLATLIILPIYLYNKNSTTVNTSITTTPAIQNIINLLNENDTYNMEFTSEKNFPKKITLGTFVSDIYLIKLFFYFNIKQSIFDNALINLIINDENGNIIHKIELTNFSNSPIEIDLLDLHVMNNYKVVLELNGEIKINSPKLSFKFVSHPDNN